MKKIIVFTLVLLSTSQASLAAVSSGSASSSSSARSEGPIVELDVVTKLYGDPILFLQNLATYIATQVFPFPQESRDGLLFANTLHEATGGTYEHSNIKAIIDEYWKQILDIENKGGSDAVIEKNLSDLRKGSLYEAFLPLFKLYKTVYEQLKERSLSNIPSFDELSTIYMETLRPKRKAFLQEIFAGRRNKQ